MSYCERALALHRQLGNTHAEAETLDSLGCARSGLGQHAEAIACLERALAYRASTGTRLWVRQYASPGRKKNVAYSVVVNPRGIRAYVTGRSGDGYATVAYSAATGALIWRHWYPGGGYHIPALAISPSGRVFVACTTSGDYATIAYRG